MVLMHDDAGQEARFQAALDLTRAVEGHLHCVDVAILPMLVGGFGDASGAAVLLEQETERETVNRERMEARLKAEDLPYDWVEETGFLADRVRSSAALADLVVLNRELDQIKYPDMRDLVGEMLVKTRKSVIAVPQSARGFNVFGTALIAWDGSEQAEAAMQAAVPLLQKAQTVIIGEIADGSVRVPAEQAAEYLSRHDISCEVRREPRSGEVPSTVLLTLIRATGADWLVMGGFGHSRFMESTFGGVTQRMLEECPVPLFLAH
ncbi:universal stress protein [Sphingosinithalassobacter tenebrarum]|uniref:Universal stress protein n=2 Tax=Stakelama tenebrarum TaxID=2711215 RepID=A0A6G6YBA6_9SPHN|nr:universal stress protein [Sphingosinithalassobacter tenebrarum]